MVETGSAAPGRTYTVDIDGPDDTDLSVEIDTGDTWTSDWLPLGEYTLTEADPPDDVTYTPQRTVTLTADGETTEATITNDHSAGRLALQVVETGSAAPGRTYTVDIDGPDDTDLSVEIDTGDTWTSDWLPLGEYTLTEADPPDDVTYTPQRTVTLTADGETTEAAITNAFGDGRPDGNGGGGSADVLGDSSEAGGVTVLGQELALTGAGLVALLVALLLLGAGIAASVVGRRGRR